MTANKDKQFKAERARQLKRMNGEMREALADAKSLLAEGRKRIIEEIKSAPSQFQAWQLPKVQKSIEGAMAEIGEQMGSRSVKRLDAAHKIGVDLVDQPLEAGGLRIAAVLPEVDTQQLAAMKTFTITRMKDVTAEIATKVRSQIGLVMIGAQTPGDAVSGVAAAVKSGRGRAITITRTEMGRAFSAATQARQEQAAEVLPGMKKQWRRSGKTFSRTAHDLADGQIVEVNEPFMINGVPLMYPRDPAGPPAETINCGCVQLPVMEDWSVKHSGKQPFSEKEKAKSAIKHDLAREHIDSDFDELGIMTAWAGDEDAFKKRVKYLPKVNAETKKLSDAQRLAIHMYTQEGWKDINEELRSKKPSYYVYGVARVIDAGLERLPPVGDDIKLYRGTQLPQNVIKRLKVGATFKDPGFLSTTTNAKQAFEGNVQFTIRSKTGRKIDALSEFPKEKEVLFPSGSEFVIIDQTYEKDGVLNITMKQVNKKSVTEAEFTLTPEDQAFIEESRKSFFENVGKKPDPIFLTKRWRGKGKGIFGFPTIDIDD